MDTFTIVSSIIIGLILAVAIAVTIWLVTRQRKLDKAWVPIEKEINQHRFNLARYIVQQHSDPEWLQKINAAERRQR